MLYLTDTLKISMNHRDLVFDNSTGTGLRRLNVVSIFISLKMLAYATWQYCQESIKYIANDVNDSVLFFAFLGQIFRINLVLLVFLIHYFLSALLKLRKSI